MKNVRSTKAVVGAGVAALWITAAACGSDLVAPDPQVIEEVQFAASLNIDLDSMEMLTNGIYRRDVVVGPGPDTLVFGRRAVVNHQGWLTDGTRFSTGQFPFVMGNNDVIRGFEDGLLGMFEGGTRLIILPPNLAYDNAPPPGSGIPQGAVLIFEVVLDSVN